MIVSHKKRNNKKGFSLIEVLVVVAIVGILAAVGIVAYNGFIESGKKTAAQSQHREIVRVIEGFMLQCRLNATNSNNFLTLKNWSGNDTQFDCDTTDTGIWRNALFDHFMGQGLKNAHGTPNPWNNNNPSCCVPFNNPPDVWILGITSIGTPDFPVNERGKYIGIWTDISGQEPDRMFDKIRVYKH